MKKIEKLLLKAYRLGQESVSYMKVINNGEAKFGTQETTTAEDEMLFDLLNKEKV